MMAYQNNFVVSLIHNNRPLREFSENGDRTCVIPFGSEYRIRLKNKTWKRCKVKVFIDGMDTNFDGGSFILNGQQTMDLERFVDDLKSGRKFKFVSLEEGTRTGEIADPTSPENGLIRVEFHPEKDQTWYFTTGTTGYVHVNTCWCGLTSCLCDQGRKSSYVTCNGTTQYNTLSNQYPSSTDSYFTLDSNTTGSINTVYTNCSSSGTLSGATTTASFSCANVNSLGTTNANLSKSITASNSVSEQTKGATVQGGESNQAFHYASDFQTDSPTILTLKMRGPKNQVEQKTTNLEDAMRELNRQYEQADRLKDELEQLRKKVQQPKGFEVILKNNLIMVKLDGKDFTSSKETTIGISDEGLSIRGKGIDIKTKDYKLVTA